MLEQQLRDSSKELPARPTRRETPAGSTSPVRAFAKVGRLHSQIHWIGRLLGLDPRGQNAGVVFMYTALGSCGTLRGEDPFNPNRLAICPAGTGQGQAQTPLSPAGFSIHSGQTPMRPPDLNRIQPSQQRPQQAPQTASEPPDASDRVSAPESPQRPPEGP